MIDTLAQLGYSMFERNLSRLAAKKLECHVTTNNADYEGFVSGLDEHFIQIYGHDINDREDTQRRFNFVLLNLGSINSITTNGKSLKYYEEPLRGFIDVKVKSFSGRCRNFLEQLEGARDDRNNQEDDR